MEGSLSGIFFQFLLWKPSHTVHEILMNSRSQQTGKFFKRWEYQTTWPASWEICMQVKKQQLELDMEQQTDSKLGKEYVTLLINLYAEYIIRNARLDEAQAGIKTAGRNINNLRYTDDAILIGWKQRTKEHLDESEWGEWKAGLKLNIQKTKIMASGPITSRQIDGEIMKTVRDFIFLAPKLLQMVTAAVPLKDARSLEEKLWPT